MKNQCQLGRETIVAMVITSLEDVLAQRDRPITGPVGEATRLVGREAVLDSLGLVTLVVDLEQRLEDEHGLSLTLADERALSQRHSPFRTVGSLTDYLHLLALEGAGNGA